MLLQIGAKSTEHPRRSVTPTKLHSISIEITLRHGSYSGNLLLTSRTPSHKNFHGGLPLKRESYLWKKNIHKYIYNTNMTKYCAINLSARYRLNFKYSRDDTYVFSNNMFDLLQHMHFHWHYFVKVSSRWPATMWENWKMVFIKIALSQSICEW